MIERDEITRMRACAHLLEPPGQEVVSQLADELLEALARAEKAEAELASRDAIIEKLWALARKMAGDTAKAQWTDDDEEMRLLFLRAVDDGDLETACAALGVADA